MATYLYTYRLSEITNPAREPRTRSNNNSNKKRMLQQGFNIIPLPSNLPVMLALTPLLLVAIHKSSGKWRLRVKILQTKRNKETPQRSGFLETISTIDQ
ncbi:hypothetical protein CDAR_259851 [Caerostris darwini]|uniref:Uncharacterized protein n=1 Tax=Caerostris darwini TaxID=1538125 RepID=A0AAV4MTG9_9ARAC|nr:hypothetical protein CDAR_259851 [Caerostris darwini]